MKKSLPILAMAVLAAVGSGCVSQTSNDQLKEAWLRSQEQVVERDQKIAELSQRLKELDGADQTDQQRAALAVENAGLRKQLERLRAEYQDMERRIAEVELTQLSPVLNQTLRDFAEKNKGLVEYDAKRGMVRFHSDLTFALGSDQVSAAAQQTLGQLAGILNSPDASKYEVRIVGHTDSVPIQKVKQQHPTNWHLAVHRAISVRQVLEAAGVSARRTGVSGYGMYRPVEQNTSKGAERNRRVEIFLLPLPEINEAYLNDSGAAAPAPATPAPAPAPSDIPLK